MQHWIGLQRHPDILHKTKIQNLDHSFNNDLHVPENGIWKNGMNEENPKYIHQTNTLDAMMTLPTLLWAIQNIKCCRTFPIARHFQHGFSNQRRCSNKSLTHQTKCDSIRVLLGESHGKHIYWSSK